MATIRVDVRDATAEQLLLEVLRRLESLDDRLTTRLDHMETRMADLTASVDALQTAVDGVAQRQLRDLTALQDQLAAALANDAADAETLRTALQAASDQADRIMTSVDQLNALGADPSTPVDVDAPPPAEEPEVIVPADPNAGVEPDDEEPTDPNAV